MREFNEEFGMSICVGAPIHTFSYVHGDIHAIGIAYRAQFTESRQVLRFDSHDTEAVAWVGESELDAYLPADDHNRVAAEIGLNTPSRRVRSRRS